MTLIARLMVCSGNVTEVNTVLKEVEVEFMVMHLGGIEQCYRTVKHGGGA